MLKYFFILLALAFFFVNVEAANSSYDFKEHEKEETNEIIKSGDSSDSSSETLENQDPGAQTMDDNGGVLTDFFHKPSILGEEKRDKNHQPVRNKSVQLIPVEDFLSITAHEYPMPRTELSKEIVTVEENIESKNVIGDDVKNSILEVNSIATISGATEDDSIQYPPVFSPLLSSLSVPPEMPESSQSPLTSEIPVSSPLSFELPVSSPSPVTLEMPVSSPSPVILEMPISYPPPLTSEMPVSPSESPVTSESPLSSSPPSPQKEGEAEGGVLGSYIEQNFLLELENMNSLTEAVEALNIENVNSPVDSQEAQDRTDVIAAGDDYEEWDGAAGQCDNSIGTDEYCRGTAEDQQGIGKSMEVTKELADPETRKSEEIVKTDVSIDGKEEDYSSSSNLFSTLVNFFG
eukprot:GFUD01007725.1.p1 GENE.GFUD01007725.1~~GFUD01007725.1.p1  ORF type:complete len:405 (-),score=94.92 GFUD01007725.1:55-1269(-)